MSRTIRTERNPGVAHALRGSGIAALLSGLALALLLSCKAEGDAGSSKRDDAGEATSHEHPAGEEGHDETPGEAAPNEHPAGEEDGHDHPARPEAGSGAEEPDPRPDEASEPAGRSQGEIGPEGRATAPLIQISEQAAANIGLTTALAESSAVERVTSFPGVIRIDPNGMAVVTARIQGKVVDLKANLGDRVRAGQALAAVQSLVPGDPPPTVTVASPMGGVVVERNVVLGDPVEPEKALFRIVASNAVIAEAAVPETEVGGVRVGQRARVTLLGDSASAEGSVFFVGSVADSATRTFPVWVRLERLGGAFISGRFGQVHLVSGGKPAVAVPRQAVVGEGAERYVFVAERGGWVRRSVRTGLENDRAVEILDGVAPGERVAVVGSYELGNIPVGAAPGGGVQDESKPHGH